MTELTVTKTDLRLALNGDCELTLTVPRSQRTAAEKIYKESTDKPMIAKISRKTKHRSLNANSYMWVLCDKIAATIRSTKEEVYRKAIRDVGEWQDTPIADEAVEKWIHHWGGNGIGWFAEPFRAAKQTGYTVVRNYYGSHVYDIQSMALLIDYIIDEAQGLDIDTMTPEELNKLKANWKGV